MTKLALRGFALTVGLCSALAVAPSAARTGDPTLSAVSCPDIVAMDVWLGCYELRVPEDRSRAGSTMLSLPVYVLELKFQEPPTGTRIREVHRSGVTLLYIHGGPGSQLFFDPATTLESWIEGLRAMRGSNLRRLVLFGQRGTEGARAKLMRCPEVRALEVATREEAKVRRELHNALTQCRDRILAAGVNLEGYSTLESVRDLIDLRRALDIRKWYILAASYGARVAAAYTREETDAVGGMILDSPDPWRGMQQFRIADHVMDSLRVVEIICHRHTHCTGGRKTMENFRDLVERARKRPLLIPAPTPADPTAVQEFGPTRLVGTVFDALHRPADALKLPGALAAAMKDDFGPFADLVASTRAPGVAPVYATNAVINCRDLPLKEMAATLKQQMSKDSLFREYLEFRRLVITETCAVFDGEPIAEAPAGRPLDIPVLILSGKLDPVTPFAAADKLAGLFYRARIQQYETMSHGVLADSMCAWSDVARFLLDPSTRGRGPRTSFLVCRDPVPAPDN